MKTLTSQCVGKTKKITLSFFGVLVTYTVACLVAVVALTGCAPTPTPNVPTPSLDHSTTLLGSTVNAGGNLLPTAANGLILKDAVGSQLISCTQLLALANNPAGTVIQEFVEEVYSANCKDVKGTFTLDVGNLFYNTIAWRNLDTLEIPSNVMANIHGTSAAGVYLEMKTSPQGEPIHQFISCETIAHLSAVDNGPVVNRLVKKTKVLECMDSPNLGVIDLGAVLNEWN